jgi:phosphoribosylaminoimidazole-succinocarboxamide synthase
MSILLSTDLPFPIFRRGKVRDVYDLGTQLLIVATDRISAFDCVMPEGIPDKGRILTAVAAYWFAATQDLVPNHFRGNPGWPAGLEPYHEALAGRAVIVEKTRPLPVECVVRGYLAGSGWKEYQSDGSVCGVSLPAGLRLADRLSEPIFTPATKAEEGHDENISFERMAEIVGAEQALRLRDLSLALYRRGAELAANRGILLADTKFEFGLSTYGELILIDEALTPDSSRYWLADSWAPGKNPPSLDKQFLRDYLETLADWDKQPPAPHLPPAIIEGIRARYLDLAGRFGISV